MFKKLIGLSAIFCFILTTLGPVPKAHADSVLGLPAPGSMVLTSPAYVPVIMRGLKVHPENPLLFDFILDSGNSSLKVESARFKSEAQRLIKYFLASLTIKEDDLWVNLSPYEKDRMVPEELGTTVLGNDMLAQDYVLKQLTASLIYPEKKLGKEFWNRVYTKVQQVFGSSNIPVNTFNKVWIVADKSKVFVRNNTGYVVGAHLKVMLEEDYLVLEKNQGQPDKALKVKASQGNYLTPINPTHTIGSQIIREIIVPEIEKEVNEGKNFATLRQIFYSMILATWYKQTLKNAFLNQVYSNKEKTGGVLSEDPARKEKIYRQYLKAYKKGVFNYIKEGPGLTTDQTVPRKYFSGGIVPDFGMKVIVTLTASPSVMAMLRRIRGAVVTILAVITIGNFASAATKKDSSNGKPEEGLKPTVSLHGPMLWTDAVGRITNQPAISLINLGPIEDFAVHDSSNGDNRLYRVSVDGSVNEPDGFGAGNGPGILVEENVSDGDGPYEYLSFDGPIDRGDNKNQYPHDTYTPDEFSAWLSTLKSMEHTVESIETAAKDKANSNDHSNPNWKFFRGVDETTYLEAQEYLRILRAAEDPIFYPPGPHEDGIFILPGGENDFTSITVQRPQYWGEFRVSDFSNPSDIIDTIRLITEYSGSGEKMPVIKSYQAGVDWLNHDTGIFSALDGIMGDKDHPLSNQKKVFVQSVLAQYGVKSMLELNPLQRERLNDTQDGRAVKGIIIDARYSFAHEESTTYRIFGNGEVRVFDRVGDDEYDRNYSQRKTPLSIEEVWPFIETALTEAMERSKDPRQQMLRRIREEFRRFMGISSTHGHMAPAKTPARRSNADPTNPPGGIDLNARNMGMFVEGDAVNMQFNQAMIAEFQKGNFSGVKGIILRIVPITSPLLF